MNAIEVDGLTKVYRLYASPRERLWELIRGRKHPAPTEFYALRDVSFTIPAGETVGIVGRNGSGKSTLLKTVCGILRPTAGRIGVNGRIAALLELGAGFNPEFTGRDNVSMNGALLGFSPAEMGRRLRAIEAFAEIGDFIDQPVKTYSSGMFVRLAFAAAIHVDPDILVVDEALAVGDAQFVHRCMLRFHEMKAQGKTIIVVTHDATAVRSLCERAIWLDHGRLRLSGAAGLVMDHYLADVFNQPPASTETAPAAPANHERRDGLVAETVIPNIDRRLGDQSCAVLGVGLYDESLRPIKTAVTGRPVVLRLTLRNNSLPQGTRLAAGYVFRNFHGAEIASSNTTLEGLQFFSGPIGSCVTLRMRIHLPLLYPGAYAFSPTAGYVTEQDVNQLTDRVENALVLELESSVTVHVLMRFGTEMELEPASDPGTHRSEAAAKGFA